MPTYTELLTDLQTETEQAIVATASGSQVSSKLVELLSYLLIISGGSAQSGTITKLSALKTEVEFAIAATPDGSQPNTELIYLLNYLETIV